MRNVYILLVLTIVLIVALLVFAFLFLEKEKHQTHFYSVESDGERSASIRIDCYKTEDKIIYKSASFYPASNHKVIHEKLVFDRKTFTPETFFRECKISGVLTASEHIDYEKGESFTFLSRDHSKFSTASAVLHAGDAPVFHEESIITYMPLIDKYNFARGGAQYFNCIYRALGLLPPARARVILNSIRDEYIKVGNRKTKTEFLAVRAKALPRCYVWVSKNNHDIVKLKIESKSLLIKKESAFSKIVSGRSCGENKRYASHEITFSSNDTSLSGTLEIPQKEGKLACVLILDEDSPCNETNASLREDISRYLAENGNVVMRFAARGTGKSQGNNAEVSLDDTIGDIENALKFLRNHERADKGRAFIVAHGSVCSYLSRLDLSEQPLKGIVMLGIERAVPIVDYECEHIRDKIRMLKKIDKDYAKILESSAAETIKDVETTEKEYELIRGKRIFLKKMRQLLRMDALAGFRSINTPLVIIYGKKDRFCPSSYIRDIEENLNKSGLQQFSTVSFRGLGHFFKAAEPANDRQKAFGVDAEVLKTISHWIEERCTLPVGNS